MPNIASRALVDARRDRMFDSRGYRFERPGWERKNRQSRECLPGIVHRSESCNLSRLECRGRTTPVGVRADASQGQCGQRGRHENDRPHERLLAHLRVPTDVAKHRHVRLSADFIIITSASRFSVHTANSQLPLALFKPILGSSAEAHKYQPLQRLRHARLIKNIHRNDESAPMALKRARAFGARAAYALFVARGTAR
jgi:hypothetical protein